MIFKHEFVEYAPEELASGTLYISIPYRTALHNCPCGCGIEVVTPLDPTDWKLTYDGETVSLYPSIGNWSFPCRSHYWIKNSEIVWAESWSDEKIRYGRQRDRSRKHDANRSRLNKEQICSGNGGSSHSAASAGNMNVRIWKWFKGIFSRRD